LARTPELATSHPPVAPQNTMASVPSVAANERMLR
jgi:hypothetical protein